MNIRTVSILAGLGAATVGGLAQAHVVLSPAQASPGGYYAGEVRISHGCAGSPTVAVRVQTPPGVVSAKPQPKPGWTVSIEHEPLARPVPGEGGQPIRERVKAITWRGGPLPDDEFDAFGLLLKLPAAPGPLYFPTVQTCESGETRWTDLPAAGQAWHDVPHPAPVLTLSDTQALSMAPSHREAPDR